jgi:hypothetical protein
MSAPDEKLRTAPDAQAEPPHPRQDLASWKWTGTMATIFLTSFISGMRVSAMSLLFSKPL